MQTKAGTAQKQQQVKLDTIFEQDIQGFKYV